MTPNGSRLVLTGVGKDYRGVTALRDVNLEINAGEFVTFLGPSGSGKTTTLNLIAGFFAPTSGDITIDGASITTLPPHERNIGMVFQNYSLFPHLTVAENVAFPLVERRVQKAERETRVAQMLDMVGLGGFGRRRPSELSGGQQQRVAIARALIYEPRLVLFDEPLGALDKKLREGLQAELRRIHRELGITMVFVTHDQEEALALSDRIVVFDQGRIVQVGTTAELYRRPGTPFVASFVGDSNLVSGQIRQRGEKQVLEAALGDIELPPTATGRTQGTVLIRPEHVKLHAERGGLGILVHAAVEDVAFLGPFTQVTCRADSGEVIKMRCPAGEGERLSPGDRVELGWRESDILLLDHDDAATDPAWAPTTAVPTRP